jgi:hypothetical protein
LAIAYFEDVWDPCLGFVLRVADSGLFQLAIRLFEVVGDVVLVVGGTLEDLMG